MADRGPRARVTFHRFFLPPGSVQAERVTFPSGISRQIERVLRLKPRERVIALDGSGVEYVVVLEHVGRSTIGSVEVERWNEAEPTTRLTLYQGLLKGTKFELVLQKCTEIGIRRVVPVMTARSVPAEPSTSRQARFETVVREAAEQSGRGCVPEIAVPAPFSEAILEARGVGPPVFCWEEEHSLRLEDLSPFAAGSELSLFVGPEGGFTTDEAEEARRAGCAVVSLGRRILRAETAAIVGSALLLAKHGDL